MTNKDIFLRYICKSLEILCCAVHPFHKFEIFLTGTHCNLTLLSIWITDKYKVPGVWEELPKEKRYYEDYPY